MAQILLKSIDFLYDHSKWNKFIWLNSAFLSILALFLLTLKSILNPFWWFSKKINPYSTYSRLPDRLTAFFFRLDITIQGLSGSSYLPVRKKWIGRLQHQFFKNKSTEGKLLPVEEFDYRSRGWEEFAETINKEPRPLYLPGFLREDANYQDWSLEGLVAKFGEEEVLLTCPIYDGYLGPLKDINIPGVYLHNSEFLFRKYPALLRKLGITHLKKLLGNQFAFSGVFQLFAGKKNSGTAWHCADLFNCFLMLDGQKKWTFINPEDSPLLLPRGSGYHAPLYYYSEALKISPVSAYLSEKLLDQDRNRLQKAQQNVLSDYQLSFFQSINRYQVILKPGDLLLSPPFWWHEVENITPESIGVASRVFNNLFYQTTNKVFQPWTTYRLKTNIKQIYSMFTQNIYNTDGEMKPIDELSKDKEKVEELYTARSRAGAFDRFILPSESVSEYYKRYGVERQFKSGEKALSLTA